MKQLDPKTFKIRARVTIEEGRTGVSLLIDRKSRIIMKDGKNFLEYKRKINERIKKPITIYTTAPVCSKTKKFLFNNGVLLRETDKKTINQK